MAEVGEPALEHAVQRRGAEDRLVRRGEVGGVEHERVRLRPAEAAVRADLVLEGGDLVEVRVVAAVDHQVGDRAVAVDLAHLLDGVGAERRQRVVAGRPRRCPGGGSRRRRARASDPPADRTSTKPISGCVTSPSMSAGVAGIDLLAREPARLAGERDQAEGCPRRARSASSATAAVVDDPGRGASRSHAVDSVVPGLGVGVARGRRAAQPADEVGQRLAGALDERRSLRLAVVGQHDDAGTGAGSTGSVRSMRPIWRSRSRSTASVSARSGPEWWETSS